MGSLQQRSLDRGQRKLSETSLWSSNSWGEHAPVSQAKNSATLSPQERRRLEIQRKQAKVEDLRARDQKVIQEAVEFKKDLREQRFLRLLDNLTQKGVAFQTAMELQEFDANEVNRRMGLLHEWEQQCWTPIAQQAFHKMNPPTYSKQFKGSRKVAFQLPNDVFRFKVDSKKDPTLRCLLQHAEEEAFDKYVTATLGRSQSVPAHKQVLRLMQAQETPAVGFLPRAVTRPVLEPELWSSTQIEGTMFGRFATATAWGAEGRRLRRGGADVFIPDESDGVPPAGTRMSRTLGPYDKGILQGDCGFLGESSAFKTRSGAGPVAPCQDHFDFDVSQEATNLEFPQGKKLFPEFH